MAYVHVVDPDVYKGEAKGGNTSFPPGYRRHMCTDFLRKQSVTFVAVNKE